MNTRRAASLVELMVILSVCAVILSTTGALVHRVLLTQSAAWAFLDAERSALRLSDQFRQDVHRAEAASVGEADGNDDVLVRLQLAADQNVEYRQLGGHVLRVAALGGDNVSHEEYAVPPGAELLVEQQDSPRRLILSIRAQQDPTSADDIARLAIPYAISASLRVEAHLNRDRRWAPMTTNRGAAE